MDILNTINVIFSLSLVLIGAVLIFIAGIGLLRMPDLYLRMSAATKAATLGVGLILAGTGLYLGTFVAVGRALLIFLFILATIPISAHLIGRAAYTTGVALWEGTEYEQLRDYYEEERHSSANDNTSLHPPQNAPPQTPKQ